MIHTIVFIDTEIEMLEIEINDCKTTISEYEQKIENVKEEMKMWEDKIDDFTYASKILSRYNNEVED